MKFFVGHCAYSGANRQTTCYSITSVLNELRRRHVDSLDAIKACAKFTTDEHVTVWTKARDVIEIKVWN